MNDSKAVLRSILSELGYDVTTPSSTRTINQLMKNSAIEHYANRLEQEVAIGIREQNINLMKRRAINKMQFKNNKSSHASNASSAIINIRMRVPNLTTGKSFSEKILLLDELPGSLELCNSSDITSIEGLNVNFEAQTIEGCITKAGDYELTLYAFQLLPNGEKKRIQALLKITVNPDPRSLWKNLPSDESARFHKPDTHADIAENHAAMLVGASVRGRSHAHKGIHRDDDFRLACSSSAEWNILCVADGAGSCKFSRRGAELASIKATRTLKDTLNSHYGETLEKAFDDHQTEASDENKRQLQEAYRHTIVKAVYEAALAIQNEIDAEQGDRFKDFSTTLLLAAHKPVQDGHLILSFSVGDGALVTYQKNTGVELLGDPDSGEFAGQTRFLDGKMFEDHSVYQRVKIKKVEQMTALILATDGITDPWFETEKEMNELPKWDLLWQELEPLITAEDNEEIKNNLINWMDFWSPGNHDDRSIALCWIKEKEKD